MKSNQPNNYEHPPNEKYYHETNNFDDKTLFVHGNIEITNVTANIVKFNWNYQCTTMTFEEFKAFLQREFPNFPISQKTVPFFN